MTLAELKQTRANVLSTCQRLMKHAKAEDRSLSPEQMAELTAHRAHVRSLDSQIEQAEDRTPQARKVPPMMPGSDTSDVPQWTRDAAKTTWRDLGTGKPVHPLTREQRMADIHRPHAKFEVGELSVGRLIQAKASGSWQHAQAEKRALSETTNTAGGFLVTDELSAMLIDKARNKSVMINAGALTVPMTSDHMTIARVDTDPTISMKGESASFTATQPIFGAATVTAHTAGCVVKMSREVAADAVDFVDRIEGVIAAAAAVQLDKWCLTGTGSGQPTGLENATSVQTAGAVADYDDLLDAVKLVRDENGVPATYIMDTTTANTLEKLKSGDGTNSAALYLNPPPAVADMQRLVSNQATASTVYLGDFSQFLIAMRQELLLEVSTDSGDAFAAHELWVKVTFRFDCVPVQPTHFVICQA